MLVPFIPSMIGAGPMPRDGNPAGRRDAIAAAFRYASRLRARYPSREDL